MTKKKVVIKVSMNGEKKPVLCSWRSASSDPRSKALVVVVGVSGVESASLSGPDKDQIEVKGEEIDPVTLTKLLKKNFCHADIVSVGPADEKKEVKPIPEPPQTMPPLPWPPYYPTCQTIMYEVPTYEPQFSCSIL